MPEKTPEPIPWDRIYLLGWYDWSGRPYLTTWDGDEPIVQIVVTGVFSDPPLWRAPVPFGAKAYAVPSGRDPQEYARELGGLYAFGWRVPVERLPQR